MTRAELAALGPRGAKAAAEIEADDRAKIAATKGHPELGDPGRAAWAKMHPGGRASRGKFSNAARTVGPDGIAHASKMEARVFERLRRELQPGERILRQIRMPLFSAASDARMRPLALTIDFAVLAPNTQDPPNRLGPWHLLPNCLGWVCWVEAKGRRKSRDWARGKAAFESTWGKIMETDR